MSMLHRFRLASIWLRYKFSDKGPWTEDRMLVIVFSKDRAMQLDFLLRSWARFALNAPRLTILWYASSNLHRQAYLEVLDRNKDVVKANREESSFRPDLLDLLKTDISATRVMFLVDDLLLIRPLNFEIFSGISPYRYIICPRLGRHICYSQTHNAACTPPSFVKSSVPPLLQFEWMSNNYDWSMPLSVDGNIFSKKEMESILSYVAFKAPNSLEAALGPARFLYRSRIGLCFSEASLCNLAINRVQVENYHFPHGDVSAESLLKAWQDGLEMDLASVEGGIHSACHITTAPKLVKR